MFRVLTLAGIAWATLGFPSSVSTAVSEPSSTAHSDTLILTSRAPSDSTVRFVLPLDDLKASFNMRTPWINIRADTLEVPSPAVLVLKEESIDIRLASRPGDPALRLSFSYPLDGASRVYCVAEGSTFHLTRAAGEERPHVVPDRTMECTTR